MKANRIMIVAISMALALTTASAVAQTINLKADVPFDFAAGNVMLKSGHCTVVVGIQQRGDVDDPRRPALCQRTPASCSTGMATSTSCRTLKPRTSPTRFPLKRLAGDPFVPKSH